MGTEKRERQRANRQLKYQQQVKQDRRQRLTRRIVIGVVAVGAALAFVVLVGWLVGRGDDDEQVVSASTTIASGSAPTTAAATETAATTAASTETAATGFPYGTGECPPAEVAEPVREFEAAPQRCIDPAATYTATIVTSEGDIVVELATADVPGTVNNFVTLARYGYYDDTLIFRTDPSIDIIQGGGRSNTDSPGYSISDEGDGFTYEAGDLAMARSQSPNSAGGQWFFVVGPDGANLDAGTGPGGGTYVTFGRITEGLDVAEGILALVGDDGQTPTREVVVETVEISET